MRRLTAEMRGGKTGSVSNDGSPRVARIATMAGISFAIAVVILVIEWGRTTPPDNGGAPQAPSEARSLHDTPSNATPSRATTASPIAAGHDQKGDTGAAANTARPSVSTTSAAQRPVAAAVAQHTQLDQNTRQSADGVAAARAIDWDKIKTFAPIPRSLPSREAADAVDAGFVPEWFEHSIGRWTTRGAPIDGRANDIEITPLAARIMSDSKSPDDPWAQGVESQVRAIIASQLPGDDQVLSRVFCSSQGCLVYLEDVDPSQHVRPTEAVSSSILHDPRMQPYGITSQTFYVTGSRGWDLILIPRHK